MNTLFNYYFVQVSILMALFYLLYWSLLRRETFFKWNRAYLLVTPLLAFGIPLLPIPQVFTQAVQQTTIYDTYVQVVAPPVDAQIAQTQVVEKSDFPFSWMAFLWGAYFTGMSFFIFRFLRSLFFILKLIKQFGIKRINGQKVVETHLEDLPIFSFGNLIFWNAYTSIDQDKKAQVMQHEITHVRQHHTLDVIYFELLGIVLWFNPICIFYKRSIKNVHEYLADNALISKGVDKKEYCDLLVSQLLDANQA
ncbi:MAG TPA: hypothetical protein DCS93_36175 [Microscillaceae bacterium]|nr:hypothetical protein [Microscillaceae bacterium]